MDMNLDIKIKVYGLGGGGGNAVENMIRHGVEGVDFALANTDLQVLNRSQCEEKILLGKNTTMGLGAGANPDIGRKACIESQDAIEESMRGYDMVFLATGMGGGTGTAAVSCFAQAAKKLGILCVAIVTKPFSFEGRKRTNHAEEGMKTLLESADSTVIVSNNNLIQQIGRRPLKEAFQIADNTLRSGVQSITDLITRPSLINLDFADVRTTLKDRGHAILGVGMSDSSENAAREAAESAVTPLLLENSIRGARQTIINIAGGANTSLFDAEDAVAVVREKAGTDIDTIFGVSIDESLGDKIVVTVIATDFEEDKPIKNFADAAADTVRAKIPVPSRRAMSRTERYSKPAAQPMQAAESEISIMDISNKKEDKDIVDELFGKRTGIEEDSLFDFAKTSPSVSEKPVVQDMEEKPSFFSRFFEPYGGY